MWQKLRYGTLVIVGVAVTGVTIYESDRRHVEAIDVIEIVEALQERQRMVDISTDFTNFLAQGVSTQQVRSFLTSSETYTLPDGTTKNYLIVTNDIDLVTTNDQQGLSFVSTETIVTGKIIWAGWDALEFTDSLDSSYENTYTLAGYYWNDLDGYISGDYSFNSLGTIGYYTNDATPGASVLVLRDIRSRDVQSTFLQNARGWIINSATVTTNADGTAKSPRHWAYDVDWDFLATYYHTDDYFDSFRGTNWFKNVLGVSTRSGEMLAVGTLASSNIVSANVTYSEQRVNTLTRTKPSQSFMNAFDTALKAMIPSFVDYFDITNGAPVYHTVTGLFATCEIGDGTNKFTRTATNDVPITFGDVPRQLKKIHLTERYTLLQKLTTTYMTPSWTTNIITTGISNITWSSYSNHGDPPLPMNVGADVHPEPWADTGGEPPWWIEVDIDAPVDFSQGFFVDPFPSRDFDGTQIGELTVVSNTSTPKYEYQWQFSFLREEGLETSGAGGPPYSIVSWWLTHTAVDDWRTDIGLGGDLEVVFENDLVDLSYTVDFYLRDMERTNEFSATYYPYPSSNWYVVVSVSDTMDSYPWTTEGDVPDKTNPTTSESVGLGARSITKGTSTSGLGGDWEARTRHDAAHDGTKIKYFGKKYASPHAIITWTPSRCVDPL